MGVSLNDMPFLVIGFVVFVIVIALGGQVTTNLQSSQLKTTAECVANPTWVNCTTVASNASGFGVAGFQNLSLNSGTIGTVLGAVVLLGLIMGAFMMRERAG